MGFLGGIGGGEAVEVEEAAAAAAVGAGGAGGAEAEAAAGIDGVAGAGGGGTRFLGAKDASNASAAVAFFVPVVCCSFKLMLFIMGSRTSSLRASRYAASAPLLRNADLAGGRGPFRFDLPFDRLLMYLSS